MERKIAVFVSYAFHPVFVPTFGIFLLFQLNTYLAYSLSSDLQLVIYSIVFLNTGLLPLFLAFSLLKSGTISSLNMEIRQERQIPIVITGFFLMLLIYLLQ